jgi:hypothetical protein
MLKHKAQKYCVLWQLLLVTGTETAQLVTKHEAGYHAPCQVAAKQIGQECGCKDSSGALPAECSSLSVDYYCCRAPLLRPRSGSSSTLQSSSS